MPMRYRFNVVNNSNKRNGLSASVSASASPRKSDATSRHTQKKYALNWNSTSAISKYTYIYLYIYTYNCPYSYSWANSNKQQTTSFPFSITTLTNVCLLRLLYNTGFMLCQFPGSNRIQFSSLYTKRTIQQTTN